VNVSANMPAATTTPTQAVDELPSITSTDVALPTTQEKPTVADEDSSATAASLGFSYLFSIWPGGAQLQLSVPYRSDRAWRSTDFQSASTSTGRHATGRQQEYRRQRPHDSR